MGQIYNPYLPLTEHVPDGEPHLFDGRVYIYGSHDKPNGTAYCEDNYVTWSAPEKDLTDWRFEGEIYRKTQDPSNPDGKMQLWAPDVTQGPDGRYYMYYCFSFYPEIGVAVSSSPAGPFEFYGHVRYPESILGGKVLQEYMPFDPAVLTDDDGRVYLYYGFCPAKDKSMDISELSRDEFETMPEAARETYRQMSRIRFGENSMVAELEPDMITLKEVPRALIPGGKYEEGTGFEGHAFFEASSIRKIRGKYYFVYSSYKSAELCYAVSDKPDRDFVYGGTIISNGDIGLNGRTKPVYTIGNNHGGIVQADGEYYIFYHRQTNGTEFSRQGCAEKIMIKDDGMIDQVEITSCGLNGGPLAGSGIYPAAIVCHMTSPTTQDWMDYNAPELQKQTRITEKVQGQVVVSDVADGTTLGYKYFRFTAVNGILLEIRGKFSGRITVSSDENGQNIYGQHDVDMDREEWTILTVPVQIRQGVSALYFRFAGVGTFDLKNIGFIG
ncbi:MAG: family 43 glycosylhydrolase [Coprococcus sp.]